MNNYANPTPLKLGMFANAFGKRWQLTGRAVLSATVGGDTYYWHEFYLKTNQGDEVTLVYEDTESGVVWRWFTMFEPECAMTPAEAVSKHVGDPLNLDGHDVTVTLVDESTVRWTEGQTPDSVREGAEARYFNAEAGSVMYVVSWTGQELEYYRGATLPASTVAKAFGLSVGALQPLGSKVFGRFKAASGSSGDSSEPGNVVMMFIYGIMLLVFVFRSGLFPIVHTSRVAAVERHPLPPTPLALTNRVKIGDKRYDIRTHAEVSVDEQRRNFLRHEYTLEDYDGNPAFLVCPLRPGATDWVLFTPANPTEPVPPTQAATIKVGQTFELDGTSNRVDALFTEVVRKQESPVGTNYWWPKAQFGFTGQGGQQRILAVWSADGIRFYRGQQLRAAEMQSVR